MIWLSVCVSNRVSESVISLSWLFVVSRIYLHLWFQSIEWAALTLTGRCWQWESQSHARSEEKQERQAPDAGWLWGVHAGTLKERSSGAKCDQDSCTQEGSLQVWLGLQDSHAFQWGAGRISSFQFTLGLKRVFIVRKEGGSWRKHKRL